MERAINRSEQCQLVGTEYGSCGSSGQCARVAISGSETVLGDRRMLHIPPSALLTAVFPRDDDAARLIISFDKMYWGSPKVPKLAMFLAI